jgi:hypothetical protein
MFTNGGFSDTNPNLSHHNDQIPESILAFRTITTMRALLQRSSAGIRPVKVEDNEEVDERHALKVHSTLATLLVRNHEVVAVTSKPLEPGSLEMQVIACVNLNGDLSGRTEFPQLSDDPVNPGRRDHHFFVAANPHDPNRKSNLGDPDSVTHLGLPRLTPGR